MKKTLFLFGCLLFALMGSDAVTVSSNPTPGFFEAQLKHPRVKKAYAEKKSLLDKLLASKKLNRQKLHLILVAYKQEQELEVYAASGKNAKHVLLKKYSICASSGKPGPKWKRGDGQVPEGQYKIDRFNPSSLYHLSLGLNFPNAADLKRIGDKDPGGDIFIHGDCVTIGCIPITDDKIKELYLLCVWAREASHSSTPVLIFPCRMHERNMTQLLASDKSSAHHVFWRNLQKNYLLWEDKKQL